MDWSQAAVIVAVGALAVAFTMRRVRHGIDRRRLADRELRRRLWLPYTLVGLLLAGTTAAAMTARWEWRGLVSWLLAVNVVAFAYYGWDKLAAKSAASRVPETTLLLLALAGGSVGALVGQQAFTHKTSKVGFQARFWLIVALQAAVVVAYARSRSAPS